MVTEIAQALVEDAATTAATISLENKDMNFI